MLSMLAGLSGCMPVAIDPTLRSSPTPSAPAVIAPQPVPVNVLPVDLATPMDAVSRRLLAHHEQLRLMSPADLAQEINRLATLAPSPDASLELAMALLQTRNGGELNRALGLVEPLAKGAAPEQRPWQPFARLLVSRLQELRRLEDLLDRRNQELRDSQREAKQLNDKLEALKAIERSLAPAALASSPMPVTVPVPTPVPAAGNGGTSPAAAANPNPASTAAPPVRRTP